MPQTIRSVFTFSAALFLAFVQGMTAATGPIKAAKTLYIFRQGPTVPNSLVAAGDGNLYGATSTYGALLKFTPNGDLSVVHDFQGEAAGEPRSLILGKDGLLYGILGTNGSVFESDLNGALTILGTLGSGLNPATLIRGADGNLYIRTTAGGSSNQGSVLRLTPAGAVTTIHDFAGGSNSSQPSELIETTAGVFYGVCTTSSFGAEGIYKLTGDGSYTLVHDFAGTSNSPSNLLYAADGNVYGSLGGSIFRLAPTGELTTIANPGSSVYDLVLGSDGYFYAAMGGGAGGYGTAVSRISMSGQVTILHNFSGQDDGSLPTLLAFGPNQTLFGITSSGSIAGKGTFYRVDAAGQFATLVRFGALGPGYYPNSAFLQVEDGTFYGATLYGGSAGNGTIYHFDPASGKSTTVHDFVGGSEATPSVLVRAGDGGLYGACFGVNQYVNIGSLFRIDASGTYTVLHQFANLEDGAYATALVVSRDGNLYGVSAPNNSGKSGSFFRITGSGTFTVVKTYAASQDGIPVALVEAQDGNLYGLWTGSTGGLFEIATDGTRKLVHVVPGSVKYLTAGRDGNLYGTTASTYASGPNDEYYLVTPGTLWRCTPDSDFTVLHTFTGSTDDLSDPGKVFQASDGNLYGSASAIYRMTVDGKFEPLYNPAAEGFIQGTDGNFYGTRTFESKLVKYIFGTPSAVNLATRMKVGTGSNVSIGGFIITGNVAKKVMLRGIGPSLSLAGKLDDPMLELHDAAGTIIGRNDNWRVSQPGGVVTGDQSADIKASGLAPFDDREAALIATLAPGNYTAVVSGTQNTAGIGLVEIYDLDPEADATLANISTRGFADTGDNVLIGGFITDGSSYGLSKLIVRALGPSLAQFGISNLLQDPSLAIYDQNGSQLAANGDWQDGNQPEIVSAGLAPKDGHESAVYVVLGAGNYTAVVSGQDGGTGVALVETYNLP
jgi:uncharacterized repeat protein (TIGR03803 family)